MHFLSLNSTFKSYTRSTSGILPTFLSMRGWLSPINSRTTPKFKCLWLKIYRNSNFDFRAPETVNFYKIPGVISQILVMKKVGEVEGLVLHPSTFVIQFLFRSFSTNTFEVIGSTETSCTKYVLILINILNLKKVNLKRTNIHYG